MQIGLIVMGVLLATAVVTIIVLGKRSADLASRIRQMELKNLAIARSSQELAFLQHAYDFPEEEIAQTFNDVDVIWRLDYNEALTNTTMADLSQYKSKNIIGITKYASEKDYEQFRKMMKIDPEEVKETVTELLGDWLDPEDEFM